ncbi:MAG: molybdenum cofactor guanylyltransferase MobA [Sulfurovaceae bacterium]|nr:molybdenum cofactor guanylyltransferase MobA [Sulfurovaceae bacterium]
MKLFNTAVIFAGGKSSRMGRDKALLPFGGYSSLSEYQYEKFAEIFKTVYISVKHDKFDFSPPLITDRYEQSSPLVGLISIFETINENEVFILSVDSPMIDRGVIEQLYQFASSSSDADVVIAKSPQGIEPLCGIYRRSIMPLAKEFFELNNHKLTALLSKSKSVYKSFDSNEPFLNLNHPDEYERAKELISGKN